MHWLQASPATNHLGNFCPLVAAFTVALHQQSVFLHSQRVTLIIVLLVATQAEQHESWCLAYRSGPDTSLLELCILKVLPSSSTLHIPTAHSSEELGCTRRMVTGQVSMRYLLALFGFDDCCQVSPFFGAVLCHKPSEHLVLLQNT